LLTVDVNIYPSEQLLSYVIPRERSVVIVQYCEDRHRFTSCKRVCPLYARKMSLGHQSTDDGTVPPRIE